MNWAAKPRWAMRAIWVAVLGLGAGCAEPRDKVAERRAVVNTGGEVQQGIFSSDGKSFLGWVTPAGKDPAAEGRKSKAWVLWSVADGTELARWSGDPVGGFDVPGTSDGRVWPIFLSGPPKSGVRCRLLDLTTGNTGDVPGVTGATETCTRPGFSADRTRMAYSNSAAEETRRTGRVYEKIADGWKLISEVPGENAVISPDGQLIATVGRKTGDRGALTVRVFSAADGKEQWMTPARTYGLRGFTPDGRYLIQSDSGNHWLLEVASGAHVAGVANSDDKGQVEAAYREGWMIAVVRNGTSVELVRWDLSARKEVSRTKIDSPYGRNRTPTLGSSRLAVAHPVQTQPAAGRRDAYQSSMVVDVYDPAAAEPITRLTLGDPGSVIVSPDGSTVAAIGHVSLSFYALPPTK